MTITLELTPAIEGRLRQQAAQDGLTLEAYLHRIVKREAGHIDIPSPNPAGEDENDDERPWRGVLVVPRTRETLFSGTTSVAGGALPRRAPSCNMNWHRAEPDDE